MVFAGTAAMAQAARMLYQGVFVPGSVYAPNHFDVFFDWATLAVLGAIPLSYGLYGYYKETMRHAKPGWVWISDTEMMPEEEFEELQQRAYQAEHRHWFSRRPVGKKPVRARH
jgi:hypothetical protein